MGLNINIIYKNLENSKWVSTELTLIVDYFQA